MITGDCNCPTDGLSDFDRGMLASFEDGALQAMGDTITLLGITIKCVVSSRTNNRRNIQAGKSVEVTATVEVTRSDFIRAGGNVYGGDIITFSDGEVGKVQIVDDAASQIYTLRVGPTLEGAAGPEGGKW